MCHELLAQLSGCFSDLNLTVTYLQCLASRVTRARTISFALCSTVIAISSSASPHSSDELYSQDSGMSIKILWSTRSSMRPLRSTMDADIYDTRTTNRRNGGWVKHDGNLSVIHVLITRVLVSDAEYREL